MGSRRHDERGIVGVILTLVIVFALVAVVELTRTLEAAQQIDTRVVDITASVKGANSHLNTGCDPAKPSNCSTALPVLAVTEGLAQQIDDAAKPLTGQAGQVLNDVNSINTTVSQILTTVQDINTTVHSINGVAHSINSSVLTIGASINGINNDVVAIKGTSSPDLALGVNDINQRVDIILGSVNGIKGDTATITTQAGQILGQAQAICHDQLAVNLLPGIIAVPILQPVCG